MWLGLADALTAAGSDIERGQDRVGAGELDRVARGFECVDLAIMINGQLRRTAQVEALTARRAAAAADLPIPPPAPTPY